MNPFLEARAALFDLDGTLIETHIDFPLMKREMLALVERYGIDSAALSQVDILSVVELGRATLFQSGAEDKARKLREEAFARLEEIELEQCRNPVELTGAAELLSRLKK